MSPDSKNPAQTDLPNPDKNSPDPIKDAVWSLINDAVTPEEVGETRKEVKELFDKLFKTPSARRVMLKRLVGDLVLDDQLVTQLEALKSDGFLDSKGGTRAGDVPPPTLLEVIASFGVEGLQRARGLKDPFLLLVPILPAVGPTRMILGWSTQFAERSDVEKIRKGDTPPNVIGGDMIAVEVPPVWRKALMESLQTRFMTNLARHPGIEWESVRLALEANPKALFSLHLMGYNGGAPDVLEATDDSFVFCDFSAEIPEGSRNINYYAAAIRARSFGVDLIDEAQYRQFQELGIFDTFTWCWLKTSEAILKNDYAMYGHRYDDDVRVSEGGADRRDPGSGWRATLRVQKA